MIKYSSTRGSQDIKTAAQAVIKGLAEDIDEAGRVYTEIERAVYDGDTEYI